MSNRNQVTTPPEVTLSEVARLWDSGARDNSGQRGMPTITLSQDPALHNSSITRHSIRRSVDAAPDPRIGKPVLPYRRLHLVAHGRHDMRLSMDWFDVVTLLD